jgi:integrase/recombinase XerD
MQPAQRSPVKPEAMNTMMKQLKNRIERLVERGEIKDPQEQEMLEYLLKTKKWNPYCIKHSAITYDSDSLPEFALKKKVRWSRSRANRFNSRTRLRRA